MSSPYTEDNYTQFGQLIYPAWTRMQADEDDPREWRIMSESRTTRKPDPDNELYLVHTKDGGMAVILNSLTPYTFSVTEGWGFVGDGLFIIPPEDRSAWLLANGYYDKEKTDG